jgi:hypothetical protein
MKIFSNFIGEQEYIYDNLKVLDKPITFFYDYIPQNIEQLKLNPYNFIMLHEPDEFFGMHTWVKNNHHLFTGILTYNETLINTLPNAVLFHHSCNHFKEDYINLFKNFNKKFEIFFLSGAKKITEGHKLRQEIYKVENQITIPKKWYYVLDDFNWEDFNKGGVGRPSDESYNWNKSLFLKDPMFHVCVENVNQNNWFTEKITDAFLTKTLPIYWGCPNISDYGYDERGIIRFKDIKELIYIINNLTKEKYKEMKPYIDYNYQIAKNELKLKDKLELFFNEFIELNNI